MSVLFHTGSDGVLTAAHRPAPQTRPLGPLPTRPLTHLTG